MSNDKGSIRERTLVDVNGVLKCNLSTLGEYLVYVEEENRKRNEVMDRRVKELMDEVVRLNVMCSKMDARIGLRTARAVKMGMKEEVSVEGGK